MTKEYCECCGASLKKYWHRITPGLLATLVKVYAGVSSKGENIIRMDELELSHSEFGNFQKLRFHALIAKHKVEGVWKRREWLMTRRGADFLKGNIDIPYRVQTFRNEVVAHDAKKIFIKDVLGTAPYFEGYEEFKNQLEFMVFADSVGSEPELPEIRSIRKKGKKMFCSCGGKVIKAITPINIAESGNMVVYAFR